MQCHALGQQPQSPEHTTWDSSHSVEVVHRSQQVQWPRSAAFTTVTVNMQLHDCSYSAQVVRLEQQTRWTGRFL